MTFFATALADMPNLSVPRKEESVPHSFRLAQYPCGKLRVQGAYAWHEGFNEHGVVWRDLPVVEVDERGRAL